MLACFRPPHRFSLRRFFCSAAPHFDVEIFKEAFSRRMAMAGIKPHHRIALGVSGGPDSMALCVLAAAWKSCGRNAGTGFIDGLLGIVVDHRLRPESTEEANLVCSRLLMLGVECQIATCEWLDGLPKKGQVQEAAREKRYNIFREICHEHGIGVLLVAHHADDQAELFILRLSRGSGVLGLAGMAFISQSFHSYFDDFDGSLMRKSLLTVRPLLEFSKEDMYKVCIGSSQEWVEDPSNKNTVYARNRIRMLLKGKSSDAFKSELQALIAACRVTRSYVDRICSDMIQQCVTINDNGYAIIDLSILDPSSVDDLCLSKLLSAILQFISQRHKPIRGAASKLLIDYVRKIPCKTSLTVAYCHLSPLPKSKGRMVLVTAAPKSLMVSDASEASDVEIHSFKGCQRMYSNEIKEIISCASLLHSAHFPPLLNPATPKSVLEEAIKLKIISEATYDSLVLLQREESEKFKVSAELRDVSKAKHRDKKMGWDPQCLEVHPGDSIHFMRRFIVSWEETPHWAPHDVAFLRHMVEDDWLHLSFLSNSRMARNEDFAGISAQQALEAIKLIPVRARRGLPVLVNSEGLPLSIPNICFSCCPDLKLTARFEPSVPLGGGFSSFM